jgi:hypothetical protein
LALAPLGFDLGIETGQAMVVALLLPLLLWMRRSAWGPRIVRPHRSRSPVIGCVWLLERLSLRWS